jgi:hypothetical protein
VGSAVQLSDSLQECASLLRFISTKPDADPFLEPVDWQLYGLSDYPEIIKTPMDLGTIQQKLDEGRYKDAAGFASDMRLIWENCMKYNRPDSDLHMTAEKLSKLFEKKYQKIKSSATTGGAAQSSGKKSVTKESNEASRADRLKFSQLVNQLAPEQLGSLVEMIQKDCPEALNEEEDDEIEIEINNIDQPTLLALNNYASNCVSGGATAVEANKKQKLK